MKYVNFTLNEVDLEFKGVFTCELEDTENETSGKEVHGYQQRESSHLNRWV